MTTFWLIVMLFWVTVDDCYDSLGDWRWLWVVVTIF